MIDSVPLIQNANDVQQINASIIAMKKASRELDEKIVKLNSLNSELDKKIALLDSGLNKEIEDRKEAINSLDVASVGGSGKYISAISETDGKISATASDITSSVSSGNSQPVTSGGVYDDSFLLREEVNSDIDNYPIDGVRAYRVTGQSIGWVSNDGIIINLPWSNANFGAQIAVDDQSNWLAIRTKSQGTWGNWSRIIDEELLNKINYSTTSRDIDTLYPSENGKLEVFGGKFSGNAPETRETAILKTFRVSSTSSSEVHLYQEWEAYGSLESSYSPNKYIRFGYFTGSASPTWSDWQRLVRDTDVGNLKFFYKNYGQVSISAGVTLYDLPTELSGKNIIMAFGAIGNYLMPRPHLNNAGQYAQSWGLGVSLTGGKFNILTPDSWSGILQVVFIYN